MIKHLQADVAVIGAGPTGAFAASQMARAGLKVLLIDRKKLGQTGAQWLNTVPEWMLKKVGIKSLGRDHIYSSNDPMVFMSACGQSRVDVGNIATFELDMRAFGKGLIEEFCLLPNAKALLGLEINDVELDPRGRPLSISGMLVGEKSTYALRIQARLFVDAGGLKGAMRKKIPILFKHCIQPSALDLCSAAQEVYEIADQEGAKLFLKEKSTKPGEMIAILGLAGNYSLLRIHVYEDLNKVAFLTGAIALPQFPSAKQLISNFLSEHSWVGARLFGGQRIIPLGRPYAVLAAPGIALVGDAACQIYATHGSGIGIGLLAAQTLASCVESSHKGDRDIGAIEELSAYPYNFQQHFGHLLNCADLFRRFSQTLSATEMVDFLNSGLITKGIFSDVLLQQSPFCRPHELPAQLMSAIKHPRLVAKIAPIVKRVMGLAKISKQFPAWSSDYYQRVWAYDQKLAELINLNQSL